MNPTLKRELIKKFNQDISEMISRKKLPAKALAVPWDEADRTVLKVDFLVDVLTSKFIIKVHVMVEDFDNLFYSDDYSIVDEDGKINTNKYDSLTLARLRLLRIAFESINHIAHGWDNKDGCYRKGSLDMGPEVFLEIRSPGLMIYHN